jgi:type I restriction enzyme M protein
LPFSKTHEAIFPNRNAASVAETEIDAAKFTSHTPCVQKQQLIQVMPKTISELLQDSCYELAVFKPSEIQAVEQMISERGDKIFVKCQVRGKDVQAKPEEIIRQLWIFRLTDGYKYPMKRLAVEYPITFGRDTSKRADIVVFDEDRPTVPYLITEVKKPKAKDGKEQLKSYTHATGAPLALWSNGAQTIIWHRKNPNYFIIIPDLPTAKQKIDDIANQPWTIETLIEKEKQREAEGLKARSLRQLIEDMEDEVLANAGVDVFEEVFKLIFTKLYDEMACYRESYKFLRFRNHNTATQLKASIQDLFDEAKREWEGVFAADEKIKLTADHLQVCVGSLEEWKLFNSNLDVVDDAFEYLASKSSKSEKGQYFTPRWVIDLCVKMLNPGEAETLVDTACGSAGFTVHSMFHVWKQILADLKRPASHLFTMEKKPRRCIEYVRDKVFAIDFDEKSVRVARCLNLIAGDGQTNVLHLNTLDYRKWAETTKQQDWLDTYNEGWRKLRKLRAEKDDDRAFEFDILMANPPFAGDIKQTDMLAPYELAHKENGKLDNAVGRDLLFIERNLDFLKPGGRMAIVLPQGRFNNANDQRVREFIEERCRILAVVGLDQNTFKPHTGTKTSVLFAQKWSTEEFDRREKVKAEIIEAFEKHMAVREKKGEKTIPPSKLDECRAKFFWAQSSAKSLDYNVFFATQRVESKDTSGDKIYVTKWQRSWYQKKTGAKEWESVVRDATEDEVKKAQANPEAEPVLYEIPTGHLYGGEIVDADELKVRGLKPPKDKFDRIREVRPRFYKVFIRDEHGHFVVQHDFFSTKLNDDSQTPEGIAEAFGEFAKKERLSFF